MKSSLRALAFVIAGLSAFLVLSPQQSQAAAISTIASQQSVVPGVASHPLTEMVRYRRRGPRIHLYVPYYLGRRYGYGPRYGRCSYWRKRCAANWGYGNSSYYGCLRYHGCR